MKLVLRGWIVCSPAALGWAVPDTGEGGCATSVRRSNDHGQGPTRAVPSFVYRLLGHPPRACGLKPAAQDNCWIEGFPVPVQKQVRLHQAAPVFVRMLTFFEMVHPQPIPWCIIQPSCYGGVSSWEPTS